MKKKRLFSPRQITNAYINMLLFVSFLNLVLIIWTIKTIIETKEEQIECVGDTDSRLREILNAGSVTGI